MSLTVAGRARPVDRLHVVRLAQHPVLRAHPELLPRAELPLALVARETGDVVGLLLGAAHPVVGVDHAVALEAHSAKQPREEVCAFNRTEESGNNTS